MQESNQINEAEVLFQKLGNTWFVFTEVENDFIYSALPAGIDPRTTKLELYDIIEEHLDKVADKSIRTPVVAA